MRLVQSAVVSLRDDERTAHDSTVRPPLLSLLDLDYMGSAEFEFGAIPKALLRFCKSPEPKVYGRLTLKAGKMLKPGSLIHAENRNKEINIHYLVRKSKEQMLVMCFEQWAFGGHPLLKDPVYPGEPNTFNICIDEDNECFFGTDSQFSEVLDAGLPESYRVIRQNPSFRFEWDVTDPLNLTMAQILAGPVLTPV